MIVFAFAVPGRFGDWCDALVTALAQIALPTVRPLNMNSAAEAVVDLFNHERANFLAKGPQPPPWLFRILRATDAPFTIALDDPEDAALDLICRHGLEMSDAIRRVSSSCALLTPCVSLPGVLILNPRRDWHRPEATVTAIARHFGMSIGPADVDEIVETLAGSGLGPDTNPPGWASLPEREIVAPIVAAAIGPYVDHFLGEPLRSLVWSRELLLADGHTPATHAVDIRGPVRALYYGPYIVVPAGSWTAEIVLGFSQEAIQVSFLVDLLVAGKQVVMTKVQPQTQGFHSVNLSFEIDENNSNPLEFRVINEHHAFRGKVALAGVTLTLQRAELGFSSLREELGLTA